MKKSDFIAENQFRSFQIYLFLKNWTSAPKPLKNISASLFGQNQELAGWE